MNQGRICISVCAQTVAELTDKIDAATGNADLIEVRFDCLAKEELGAENASTLVEALNTVFRHESRTPWITTFRPLDRGGSREISDLERRNFWNTGYETELADLEEDVVDYSWSWLWLERICSYHDFTDDGPEIDSIFNRLADTGVDIVKIATRVNDATEAIPVWKLLRAARERNTRVIPIAMGEAGKWTRILGLAHGAPIAYASLDDGGETAPGQISAKALRDVFRAKDLDESTNVYAVIAGDTSYTLSPHMHNAAFKSAGLNSVFVPMQVGDLDEFMRRMVKPAAREIELNLCGFSVTNPHKLAIIDHLDQIDETARKIGAVNTVKIEDGKFYGYNTDAPGFIAPLLRRFSDLKDARVAIIGAGGAARACAYALREAGANVTVFYRDPSKASAFAEEFNVDTAQLTTDKHRFATFDVLVNATPMGTKGVRENESVAKADGLHGVKLVYDLVYNPGQTRLLREAKAAGAETLGGLEMVIAQGTKQFEIWTGGEAPLMQMRAAVEERLR